MTAPRVKIHLREGTLADIHRLTDISVQAFLEDNLHDAIFPHRREFLSDHCDSWYLRLRKRSLLPANIYILAEIDVEEEENGRVRREIVGWAHWVRNGNSETAENVMQEGEFLLRRM